ncbi:AraC family transcriptional regulator [Clostridia bacterium]|nr:AraC family transcriptional regulator [Clostridia bacterium]GHV14232.1 AraC family transcriptional regulator [Clostridia bacterium]
MNTVDGSGVFDEGKPKIVVRNETHNGTILAHAHSFFEFVYVDKGFSLHSLSGRMTILTSGDLFAVCPPGIHSYFSACEASIYNILFDPAEFGSFEKNIRDLPGMKRAIEGTGFPLVKIDLSERRDFVLMLERIKWERQAANPGWELMIKNLLTQVIVTFSRLLEKGGERSESAGSEEYLGYVYKALVYIEGNFAKDITTQDIARHIGLSPGYISRQFRDRLQMTPASYIRAYRVARATELLGTTSKSITEIASSVGYSDVSVFSRIFKQVTGNNPMSFKRERK